MTKREAAFALFDEGKAASSPEVKALKLKSHTRANYYYDWKQGKGKPPSGLSAKTVDSVVSGILSPRRREIVGGIDETRQRRVTKEAKEEEEAKEEVEEAEETTSEKLAQDEGIGVVNASLCKTLPPNRGKNS